MKRYDIIPHYGCDVDIEECSTDGWVDADIAQDLYNALKDLQSDCKQGIWIERERWLQVSKALKNADKGI